jgi:hypothetical protein
MACKSCAGVRRTYPLIQQGLPTIYADGPFPGTVQLSIEEGNAVVLAALGNS